MEYGGGTTRKVYKRYQCDFGRGMMLKANKNNGELFEIHLTLLRNIGNQGHNIKARI